MGAVSLREDAWERIESVLPTQAWEPEQREQLKQAQVPVPTYPCPNCESVFASAETLSAHLFSRHSNHGYYVRLNDTVPADVVVVPEQPWQFDAVVTGSDLETLHLHLPNGQNLALPVEPGQRLSLLPHIHHWPTGTAIRITGSGRFDRQYTVYRDVAPDLNVSDLDALVLRGQEPLYEGGQADWRILLREREAGEPLRTRYLEGFAELLMGMNAEVFLRDIGMANRGYTRAFGQLRIFASPLARAATMLLAFRMDAYRLVLRAGHQSTLWAAAHYYQAPPRAPEVLPPPGVADRGVWIDAYMEGLLAVAHHALSEDFDVAYGAWRELPNELKDGPGYAPKHDIAGARLALTAGDGDISRRLYSRLVDHPLYEREARQALQ